MLDTGQYFFVSLGTNCYMRAILSKSVKNNPTDPWAGQHFLDAKSLKMYLNAESIKTCLSDITPFDYTELSNPSYWGASYKVYCSHIHHKEPYKNVEQGRELHINNTIKNLNRLKSSCENKKIVFITAASRSRTITLSDSQQQCYDGYDYTKYEGDINDFLSNACFYLNINKEDCFFINTDTVERLEKCKQLVPNTLVNDTFKISKFININNGFIIESQYSPESFSFQTDENQDLSKEYWPKHLNNILHYINELEEERQQTLEANKNIISIFSTFYLVPDNPERQNELLRCLEQNNNNVLVKNIVLMLDGKCNKDVKDFIKNNIKNTNKINFVNVGQIPTYGNWIEQSKRLNNDLADISVFINSDIFIDETAIKLRDYIKDVETIVCLSRYEVGVRNKTTPHPNPKWSQDLWAISRDNIFNLTEEHFIKELNIHPTGVYRCDNKLAYLFAMRGWRIFNPFSQVKSYHLQNSVERGYKKMDTSIIGSLCFVLPTDSPQIESELDISVMPLKVGGITKCAINRYLQKNLYPELEMSVELRNFKPCYTWPSKAIPFREYFVSDNLKIFIIENVIHNFEWLKSSKDLITKKHFFFVYLGWNHSEYLCTQTNQIFEMLKLNKNNFFFMCNSKQELNILTKFGFKGALINHNAWLDENLYTVDLNAEKIYDALFIARLTKFKRHYLASKVNNLALIAGGIRHGNTDNITLPPHTYNNDEQLNLNDVIKKINQSQCGLCLSKEEGASFSSSEYLLCGIPVVSTVSEGGRDVWYDSYNSIICDDSIDSVAEAVEFFITNKRDPELIRSNHIALAKQQRAVFVKTLQRVFVDNQININAAVYFRENFFNKMRKSCTPDFNTIFK